MVRPFKNIKHHSIQDKTKKKKNPQTKKQNPKPNLET